MKKAEKVLVLGVDGMDPGFARKFLKAGVMPNLKKFLERGSSREDLVMLGGMPTITPPMWTTLATGAYPSTHGITCYFRQDHEDLDSVIYNLDSRNCKAEQLWNVLAESGKKTLVWHWPGSSWPPSSDSPNLSVVEGTNPVIVNYAANADWEKVLVASSNIKSVSYQPHAVNDTGAGCIIENLKSNKTKEEEELDRQRNEKAERDYKAEKFDVKRFNILLDENDAEFNVIHMNFDLINSPIREPLGWAVPVEGAKEFTMITSHGLVRRPCLMLRNEDGKYDRVAIYKNKKAAQPLAVLDTETMVNVIDMVTVEEDDGSVKEVETVKNVRIIEMNPDGTFLKMWLSAAMEVYNDSFFHPKSLCRDILDNVGCVQPIGITGGMNPDMVEKAMLKSWDLYEKWQADCINYAIAQKGYEVVFSHLHNVDICGHQIWPYGKNNEKWPNLDEKVYHKFYEYIYKQTDNYFGRFMHLLDEGWTIIITSDHGLIVPEHQDHELLGESGGVNVQVLEKLGYTAVKRDENGNRIKEIDWENTRALAVRGNYIWINLKGRDKHGIVDPADKYQLEGEIIDALYNYRDPATGKRLVSLAVRNKDAAVFGMDGPETGDIIYFIDEGFNIVHGDSLPTFEGYFDSTVSPLFAAAGVGIKENFKTDRVIRQVDVAPTIAEIMGVRKPAQCEGGPIYQILAD